MERASEHTESAVALAERAFRSDGIEYVRPPEVLAKAPTDRKRYVPGEEVVEGMEFSYDTPPVVRQPRYVEEPHNVMIINIGATLALWAGALAITHVAPWFLIPLFPMVMGAMVRIVTNYLGMLGMPSMVWDNIFALGLLYGTGFIPFEPMFLVSVITAVTTGAVAMEALSLGMKFFTKD